MTAASAACDFFEAVAETPYPWVIGSRCGLDFRTLLYELPGAKLKREQLLRQLGKDARAAGSELTVNMARGKGGHCVVWFKGRFSVVKSGEITPLMEKVIRKQLGL